MKKAIMVGLMVVTIATSCWLSQHPVIDRLFPPTPTAIHTPIVAQSTVETTTKPTVVPTAAPTATMAPTSTPAHNPTPAPTAAPTAVPTAAPTPVPTAAPADEPAHNPPVVEGDLVSDEEAEEADADQGEFWDDSSSSSEGEVGYDIEDLDQDFDTW